MNFIIKVLINAAALWVAARFVPGIDLTADIWQILLIALVFGLINTFLKPILKVLSLPITLVSLGLFTFILNALLLLLVAFLANSLDIDFTIGGFPPDFTADSFVGALIGSIVISIVSVVLSMLDRGRRIIT